MKKILIVLALLCSGIAVADELGDAARLLETKDYPKALTLYARLAAAGNVEAQFHLGEMHWYGEAGKVDLAAAQSWFQKAAAGGSREAAVALETMCQRELRRADIAYWTGSYDGSDLKAGKFNCGAPSTPPKSTTNDEIKQVTAAFRSWQACYNDFVQNMNDAMPTGERIPPDVARLMNQIEYDQAVTHLSAVVARVAAGATTDAAAIVARQTRWKSATEEYVAEQNRITKLEAELALQRRKDLEDVATAGRPIMKSRGSNK
jgi:TPR repeat protein